MKNCTLIQENDFKREKLVGIKTEKTVGNFS